MKVDAYTKIILTVIAVALTLNVLQETPLVESATAHSVASPNHVYLQGWIDKEGKHNSFDDKKLPVVLTSISE